MCCLENTDVYFCSSVKLLRGPMGPQGGSLGVPVYSSDWLLSQDVGLCQDGIILAELQHLASQDVGAPPMLAWTG